MMGLQISVHDIRRGLRSLGIDRTRPILVHSSLTAFGEIRGGAESLLGALLSEFDSLMMPAFTYKTMLTPEAGPDGNGILYGSGKDRNRMAEFFTPGMPADRLMGRVAETLRQQPSAVRSGHPILSFTGINVREALQTQTIKEPLTPIRYLTERGGWVLLLGVNHTVNTSIHYAEKLASRPQFVRWALTPQAVVECPNFPGCSSGFDQASQVLEKITRRVTIGNALVQALPLSPLLDAIVSLIRREPRALLCNRPDCEPCSTVRQAVSG